MNIEDSPENVSDSEYVPDNRNIKQMLEQNSKNVARQNITTKAPKAKTPKPSSKANAEKAREAKKQKIVISKKVAKSAVVRNRIRRRIYEQVRIQAPHYLKNHDVVITIYDASLAVCESAVIEDLIKKIVFTQIIE